MNTVYLDVKAREPIKVGDDITITITRIRGSIVNVGIDCPRDLPVKRLEVLNRDDPNKLPTEIP